MNRTKLISLGNKIVNAEGTEVEIEEMIEQFNQNISYPSGASLFFWPENFNFRKDDISKYNPTVEEVVDKCLAYKATLL